MAATMDFSKPRHYNQNEKLLFMDTTVTAAFSTLYGRESTRTMRTAQEWRHLRKKARSPFAMAVAPLTGTSDGYDLFCISRRFGERMDGVE